MRKISFRVEHSYAAKHEIDLEKAFWWEDLPILRHLATKRLTAKMQDARLNMLLDLLGIEFDVANDELVMRIDPEGLFRKLDKESRDE